MPGYNKHRPVLTILLTLLLLGAGVWLFSIPSIKAALSDFGLNFPSKNEIIAAWYPDKKGAIIPKKINKKIQSPHYDSLTIADKRKIDTLRSKVNFLENFSTQNGQFSLSGFFTALGNRGDSAVHIWYFGDSQIEGDRITQDLRLLMQQDLGGSGLGYIPFSDVASYRTVELKPGNSWLKLNCFTNRAFKGFGFAGKVFKLNTNDTAFKPETRIWISPSQKYRSLWLLCGSGPGGELRMYSKDSSGKKILLPPTKLSSKFLLSSVPIYGNISLSLPAGNNYFGFLLEGNGGIQIDNCGIRGHSGDGLKFIQDGMIVQQAAQLNAKLFVFHIGNNMVPYLKSADMKYFQQEFESVFRRYKRLVPSASILVISPGDMGFISDEKAISYPFIQELSDAMRQAAQNSGAAYFDMYAYMLKNGGINAWERKGLANIDGHLSPAGQYKLAKAIYDELKKELEVHQIINKTL